jgi:Heavy metal binding domain
MLAAAMASAARRDGPVLSAAQPLAVRFHHLHYRVADPGAALGDAAARLGGTRVVAPGLGVGVRVARQYVLFERESEESPAANPVAGPAEAYGEAVAWLRAHGLDAQPASLAETAVASGLPHATFDHIGFAADDPAAVVTALKESPVSASEEAARFRLPSGLVLEIVRDTDRPDAFWCPMHPDVRSPGAGRCAVCGMALVPIPPPSIGEYRLDVSVLPSRTGSGAEGFRFVVRDPTANEAVSSFVEVHERIFHLFVISRDLAQFAHIHPERRNDGSFEVKHQVPAGEYMLIADFLPGGGTPQTVQRAIVTPGYKGPLFGSHADLKPGPVERVVEGLRIRLHAERVVALREAALRFEVLDAATGAPVTDLEPYLGAAGHLLVVRHDLATAFHGHPEGVLSSGPIVTFGQVLPAPGAYKMWVQFQRKGRVATADFVIEATEPSSSR